MSRYDRDRLDDIVIALAAIDAHLTRGPMEDDLVFDAVRVRLIEIGEAVKSIDAALLNTEPDIPWSEIAKLRDKLTHHYFDLSRGLLRDTVDSDLRPLRDAVDRLSKRTGA